MCDTVSKFINNLTLKQKYTMDCTTKTEIRLKLHILGEILKKVTMFEHNLIMELEVD